MLRNRKNGQTSIDTILALVDDEKNVQHANDAIACAMTQYVSLYLGSGPFSAHDLVRDARDFPSPPPPPPHFTLCNKTVSKKRTRLKPSTAVELDGLHSKMFIDIISTKIETFATAFDRTLGDSFRTTWKIYKQGSRTNRKNH